jgi:hypothetical protein
VSTTTEAIERFAADTGIKLVTLDRITRALRNASTPGIWPKGGKGGGRSAAHVQAHHLVNLILSLPAPQPSDALEMVSLLRPLLQHNSSDNSPDAQKILGLKEYFAKSSVSEKENSHIEQGGELGKYLEKILSFTAGYLGVRPRGVIPFSCTAVLCPDDPSALVITHTALGNTSTQEYKSIQGPLAVDLRTVPRARPRQIYIIPPELIVSAADLLADSVRRTDLATRLASTT